MASTVRWRVRLGVVQGDDGGKKAGSCLLRVEFRVAFGLSRGSGYTSTVRAGASGRFVDRCPLRSISDALPLNRSVANLLIGELLDLDHWASAFRAKPSARSSGVGGYRRCRAGR